MTTRVVNGCNEDEGGGGQGNGDSYGLTNDQYQQASLMLNRPRICEHQQDVDIFVQHLDSQQNIEQQQRERRCSLPADAIELTTLTGVVRRRKQQLQLRYKGSQEQPLKQQANCTPDQDHQANHLQQQQQQQQQKQQQQLMPMTPKAGRPLSISSISSAASSGSSSSANSSTSSGIQSSLTRNGSINYGNEFRKNYLASIDSLNNPTSSPTSFNQAYHSSGTQTSSVIENALRSLNLSSGQFKDAATRAAVLAAGESQRRGFGGSPRGSRINRSLHASLRYDKHTAYRIHLMANARALLNTGQPSTTGGHPSDEFSRRGSPVSRNNSSTSSDSGHFRSSPRDKLAGPFNEFRMIGCKCGHTMTSSTSAPMVIDRIASDNCVDDDTTKNSSDAIANTIQLFNNKAATLDGASCQRNDTSITTSNNININSTTITTTTTPIINHQFDCPLSGRPRRASAKLQPSPSSASSHSNTSSLFRDDGFEDDLTSTSSEHTSTISTFQRHHRFSFQGYNFPLNGRLSTNHLEQLRQHGEEEDDYQSCEEEFSNSHTTASTTSNLDDCALSTTSSSIIINHHQHQHQHHHNQELAQVLDQVSLADVKKQYRKSLLLEHHQQQLHSQQPSGQSKIQALLQPSPPKLISHLTGQQQQSLLASSPSSNTSSASLNISCTSSASSTTKQIKCDDRTVNIIGHMPTKSPGYWDSNLSISQRVVTEIIETERTYVDDLEQIVTGYICYLRNILKQQQKQHKHQGEFADHLDQRALADGKASDGDDKSMLVFDDDLTSATNEVVDDYDVEETDTDIGTKDIGTEDNVNSSATLQKGPSSKANETNQRQSKEAIISAINIKKLFSNLEDIYKFNKDLLFRLEECYLNPSSVAECFVENASGFEVYTHYCTMYPQVVSTLTELVADPNTAQLFKERQTELNQSLPLGAYLLKPVQRILKYHILFQSLINHTVDDESVSEKDGQLISKAFSVMTNIACHINTMKRRHEHSIRVQEVQGLLVGWRGPDLTTLGELILEDTFKLYNRQKSARHLFLFDNVLLITKKKRDGSLCYKGHIECSNLMLIEKIEGQPLVFNTVPFDNPKAFYSFQAKNLDKKRDWCFHIKDVIIRNFEVKIPVHVRDILMSLTNSGGTAIDSGSSPKSSSSETSRAIKAPNYLDKKRMKHQDKKR